MLGLQYLHEVTDYSLAKLKHIKAKRYADIVLATVRQTFNLGSFNISPTQYSPHSDSYHIFPGTLIKNYNLEALLDTKVQKLAKNYVMVCREAVEQFRATLHTIPSKHRQFAFYKFKADLADKAGAGNCGELAIFAFFQLLKMRDIDCSVEYVTLNKPRDHIFLVLNRDYATDVADWRTWNETAVILDPWLGAYYSPIEICKVWQDNGRGFPSPWLGINYQTILAKQSCKNISLDLITIKKLFDRQDFLMKGY